MHITSPKQYNSSWKLNKMRTIHFKMQKKKQRTDYLCPHLIIAKILKSIPNSEYSCQHIKIQRIRQSQTRDMWFGFSGMQ